MADELPIMSRPAGLLAPNGLRQQPPRPKQDDPLEGIDITIDVEGGGPGTSRIDPTTGSMLTETDDGGVIITFDPSPEEDEDSDFGDNLADKIGASELGRIAEELLRGIQLDDSSRTEWLEMRALGLRLLGLTIEQPKGSMDASVALEGMSTVRHPLLQEAVVRFQANASPELLPAAGPVKVSNKVDGTPDGDLQAQALEDDLNYYLTNIATEYYPDTDRALFFTGFSGCSFKKVYNDPIKQRPISQLVDATDLIISDHASDLANAARVTHVIKMRPSVLRRMQLAGAYRDIRIPSASWFQNNPVQQQVSDIQGIDQSAQQQVEESREHTIYEVYCELDIKGFEHKDDDGPTGLPLPYRVVIEKDSRTVLEVRRNWDEDDPNMLQRMVFVKFSYIRALGFYDLGLVHLLGNTTNALTAAWREMLDSGMYANFPGLIIAKQASRQNTNELRVPPGGAVQIDPQGLPIQQAVMALPYKDVLPGLNQLVQHMEELGARIGGTAEIKVGEGNQEAPVGTTLALLEQATKIEMAVHKNLHQAQGEEFRLLKRCFQENPESFLRAVERNGRGWNVDTFLAALDNAAIVPASDPNTPSHIHRLMKAMGLKQLAVQSPAMYNMQAVDAYVMEQAGISDPSRFFTTQAPGAAPPDPKLIETALKGKLQEAQQQARSQDNIIKLRMQANESADQAAERESRERIAQMHLQEAALDHSARQSETRAGVVNQHLDTQVRKTEAEAGITTAKHDADARKEEAKAEVQAAKAKPAPTTSTAKK